MKKSSKAWIITGFALLFLFICGASCCKLIDNSEVGIKFKKFSLTEQGKLITQPVNGLVFINPFTTSIFTYPVYVQRVDYPAFTVTTKDAATFSMDPNLAYMVNRDKATDIFTNHFGIPQPKVGEGVAFQFEGRDMRLCRMPSSSRAYPMALEKKAACYMPLFQRLKKEKQNY